MTMPTLVTRARALRIRPLAACLTAACAASVSVAALANPDVKPTLVPVDPLVSTSSRVPWNSTASTLPFAGRIGGSSPAPNSHTLVVTNCNDRGAGSLRDTIGGAADHDIIDLSQLTCSTISLSTGGIYFTQDNLTLDGPGRNKLTIDGSSQTAYGEFVHAGIGYLYFYDMTIAHGSRVDSGGYAGGGCIRSAGSVTLERVDVQYCEARGVADVSALGGAVFAAGHVYLRDSRVEASLAYSGSGYASGGGVYALNGFQSFYSTIANNSATTDSSTPSFGGGVFARGPSFLYNSTVSGNSASRIGGVAFADNNNARTRMSESTVSGNRADRVGGMYTRPQLNLYNSTISFNTSHSATDGNGNYFAAGLEVGNGYNIGYSSILSNNVIDGFGDFDLSGNPEGTEAIVGSNNLIMEWNIAIPSDTIEHTDPGLGPLQDNGGATLTHKPASFSAGINEGANVHNDPWDQRGPSFPRVADGVPDIGAFEVNTDVIFVNGFN